MRFAYLILAHDNYKVLEKLISMLDDSRNDIYVHIDKKVRQLPTIVVHHSRLYFIHERIDVRWGTLSQAKAMMSVFNESQANGSYDYYHLISGTHLPLKSQDYIHAFFESMKGFSVFRIWPLGEGEVNQKLRRIHFGIDNFQSKNKIVRYFVQRFWTLNQLIQKVLGIRINKKFKFIKADEWASLTESAVQYILSNSKSILKKYRYSFCCDEFVLASELSCVGEMPIINCQNMLYCEFGNAHPSTLNRNDYERLLSSEYIFARKFSDESI